MCIYGNIYYHKYINIYLYMCIYVYIWYCPILYPLSDHICCNPTMGPKEKLISAVLPPEIISEKTKKNNYNQIEKLRSDQGG
jgi:hypothetical protein